jgi:hypothetical protein
MSTTSVLLRSSSYVHHQPKSIGQFLSSSRALDLVVKNVIFTNDAGGSRTTREEGVTDGQRRSKTSIRYSTSTSYACHDDETTSTNPLFALVKMMTTLKHKRTTANEMYVRRVLQEQIGLSEYDLDRMYYNKNHTSTGVFGGKKEMVDNNDDNNGVFRLSVRHDIEPVVYYLRSIGITGSALVDLIVQKPLILGRSVEKVLIPLVDTLRDAMDDVHSTAGDHNRHTMNTASNTRAPAVLLKCPRLAVDVDVEQVQRTIDALGGVTGGGVVKVFLWEFPDEFCDLAARMFNASAPHDTDADVLKEEVVDLLLGYQQQQQHHEGHPSSSSSARWRETKRMLRERIRNEEYLS